MGPCLPIAEANARAIAAAQRNEQRYKAELAKKHLEIIAFPKAGVDQGDQTDVTLETRDGKRMLVVPSYTCAVEEQQFAKTPNGELYALAIHRRATNDAIVACACQPDLSAASGCGGAHVAPLTILYALPDKLTFKGTLEIAYDLEPHTILFTGRAPDGGDCPPPEDPPP